MDSNYGEIYEDLYRRHWWFRARERILAEVISKIDLVRPADILDVGCGNGLFFDILGQYGNVVGIEIDESLIPTGSPNRERIFSKPLGDSQYAALRFDLITALDVVEHIEDDHHAIEAMLAMLRPGGKLLITVPASMLLWDRHDEINRHYRRYTHAGLRSLLSGKARIVCVHHLFHALFLPKLAVKTLNRLTCGGVPQHAVPSGLANRAMETLCWLEYRVAGPLRIPFGTSLLAIAEKLEDQCG